MPETARFLVNTGTVTVSRFVTAAGAPSVNQAALGDAALGIALQNGDASLGESVTVDQALVNNVESGDVFAAGVQLMSDADGRAVEWDANPAHVVVGVSVDPSTGAGDFPQVDVSSSGWSQSFADAPYAVTFQATNDLAHVNGATWDDQILSLSFPTAPTPIGAWITDPADSTKARFPTTGLYAFTVETFSAGNDNSLGVNVVNSPGDYLAAAYVPPTATGSDGISASGGGWIPVTDINNDAIRLRATSPDSAPSTYSGSTVRLRIWRVGDLPT